MHITTTPTLQVRVKGIKVYAHQSISNHFPFNRREEKTALHRACARGHKDVVKLLLSYGAPPDGNPTVDKTPLFETCYKGSVGFFSQQIAFNDI